ncbi:hypothetical protein N7488_004423 [Penicillium malachiteum]|nr:hypothetical protein N7488_004423 [Penicillium malachiteum]
MRPNYPIGHHEDSFQQSQSLDAWDDDSQYAPTPGTLCRSPATLSDRSYANVDPAPSIDYNSSQRTAPPKDSLRLLQFGD